MFANCCYPHKIVFTYLLNSCSDFDVSLFSKRKFHNANDIHLAKNSAFQSSDHLHACSRAPGKGGVYDTLGSCFKVLKIAYRISSDIRRTFFSFQNNPKDLDPSYKTDLDL